MTFLVVNDGVTPGDRLREHSGDGWTMLQPPSVGCPRDVDVDRHQTRTVWRPGDVSRVQYVYVTSVWLTSELRVQSDDSK